MYKIGEFAQITNVSVHTLRHYDDIELFQASQIDAQSGYRYYTVDQLPTFHQILALRELGLSLQQIKSLMNNHIDEREVRGMLRLKQQEVQAEIDQASQRLRRIEARLQMLDTVNPVSPYNVVIKSAPECIYLSTGHITVNDQAVVTIICQTYEHIRNHQEMTVRDGLIIIRDAPTPEGLLNIEAGYIVQQSYPDGITIDTGRHLTTRQLPAIETMATVIHDGSRDSVQPAYQVAFQWMEANGYDYYDGEYVREVYLKAGQTFADDANMVELQIPILLNH